MSLRLRLSFPFVCLLLLFTLSSCEKECIQSYEVVFYEPVYSEWDEIRASIGTEAPRPIENPGKLFVLGQRIFISEVDEGVHVIDNSDPSDPQITHFIRIPGALDIAASGDKLYADNYTDLIVLDISDLDNVTETGRVSNVFTENGRGFWFDYSENRVITGWEESTDTHEYDCAQSIWHTGGVDIFETSAGPVIAADAATDVAGKAGSMARFALLFSHLFALDSYRMHTFDISGTPGLSNTMDLPWGVETIFPYGNHLFIGAMDGMHILNIDNPADPSHLSTYAHIRSCDPVVVQDDLAYVTLRSGTECQGFTNQLDIIDISDLYQPELLTSYDMHNPHGLGLASGTTLFLCDGDAGLKIFDVTDPMEMELMKHYDGIHAFDVIPFSNSLLMIGEGGFYQYDYTDLDNISLVSTIPVNP